MKNADMPAMPAKVGAVMQTSSGMAMMPPTSYSGLTKREMMAMHMMQGLVSAWGQHDVTSSDELASDAVMMADSLLSALEGKQ